MNDCARRECDVEKLLAILHGIYQVEAHRQDDSRWPDDYDALPEDTKEFDRVLARYILEREATLTTANDKLVKATKDRDELVRGWMTDVGRVVFQRDKAEARNEKLVELLKENQWSEHGRWLGTEGWEWREDLCFVCHQPSPEGHSPDCQLAKALGEEENRPPVDSWR